MSDLVCVLMIDEACGSDPVALGFVCQSKGFASEGLTFGAIPTKQFMPLLGCEFHIDESPEHIELTVARDRRDVVR